MGRGKCAEPAGAGGILQVIWGRDTDTEIQILYYRRSLSVEVDEAGRALGARRVCWRVSLPSCLVEEVQRRLAGQSGPGGRRKKGKG